MTVVRFCLWSWVRLSELFDFCGPLNNKKTYDFLSDGFRGKGGFFSSFHHLHQFSHEMTRYCYSRYLVQNTNRRLFSRLETTSVIWENQVSLRRNEPLKIEYRLINIEPRKAFTMTELSIWMENSNSTSERKESESFHNRMDVSFYLCY